MAKIVPSASKVSSTGMDALKIGGAFAGGQLLGSAVAGNLGGAAGTVVAGAALGGSEGKVVAGLGVANFLGNLLLAGGGGAGGAGTI